MSTRLHVYSHHIGKAKAKDRDDKTKPNEPKAGADVGKIVNLMAVDTNRVRSTTHSPVIFPDMT